MEPGFVISGAFQYVHVDTKTQEQDTLVDCVIAQHIADHLPHCRAESISTAWIVIVGTIHHHATPRVRVASASKNVTLSGIQ